MIKSLNLCDQILVKLYMVAGFNLFLCPKKNSYDVWLFLESNAFE